MESDVHRKEKGSSTAPIEHAWSPIHFRSVPTADGGIGLKVDRDGSWQFTGHFHDGGGVNHCVAAVIAIRASGPVGTLFVFRAEGIMQVSNGKRTYSWDRHGMTAAIKSQFADLVKAHDWKARSAIRGPATATGFGAVLSGISNPPAQWIDMSGLVSAVEADLKAAGEIKIISK
ncbi:MAG: hypothetical protein ACHQ50_07080 [Fimbriimonadales bacterium]